MRLRPSARAARLPTGCWRSSWTRSSRRRIAAWWADRLGTGPRSSDDGSFWWLEPTAGLPVDWVFQTVPEPKRVKNRIHWDVLGDTAGLIGSGATLLRPRGDDLAWDVLADPEGNEFCVFPPR